MPMNKFVIKCQKSKVINYRTPNSKIFNNIILNCQFCHIIKHSEIKRAFISALITIKKLRISP